jgi:hypothetical protein
MQQSLIDFDQEHLVKEQTLLIYKPFNHATSPINPKSIRILPISVTKNISSLISTMLKSKECVLKFRSGLILGTKPMHDSIHAFVDLHLKINYYNFLNLIIHPENFNDNISQVLDILLLDHVSIALWFFQQFYDGSLKCKSIFSSIVAFIDSYFRVSLYTFNREHILEANIMYFIWANIKCTEFWNPSEMCLVPAIMNGKSNYRKVLNGANFFYSLVNDKSVQKIKSFKFDNYDQKILFELALKVTESIRKEIKKYK